MTIRLQKLDAVRQRLESALADDPQWQALQEARLLSAAGASVRDVANPKALAESKLIREYLEVLIAIKALKAGQDVDLLAVEASETTLAPAAAFAGREAEAVVAVVAPTGAETASSSTDKSDAGRSATSDILADAKSGAVRPQGTAFRTRVNVKSQSIARPAAHAARETALPQTLAGDEAPVGNHQSSALGEGELRLGRAHGGDDLTRIRRIDRSLAQRLNAVGVDTFEQIAAWDRFQVRQVRDALGLGKRIWIENWIEQAALLHMRGLTARGLVDDRDVEKRRTELGDRPEMVPEFPTVGDVANIVHEVAGEPRVDRRPAARQDPDDQESEAVIAEVRDKTSPTAGQPRVCDGSDVLRLLPSEVHIGEEAASEISAAIDLAAAATPTDTERNATAARRPTIKVGQRTPRLPAPAARRFVYIQGVSDAIANALRAGGVHSIAEIANWSRSDVRWFQAMLGAEARISRDQWIEQASILARGHWTRYALRVVSGETRLLVEAPAPIIAVLPRPAAEVSMTPAESADAVGGDDVAPATVASGDAVLLADGDSAAARKEVFRSDAEDADGLSVDATSDAGIMPPVRFELDHSLPTVDAPPPIAELSAPDQDQDQDNSRSNSQYDPLRNLTQAIALGKIRRPPPDLGLRWQQPQPSAAHSEPSVTQVDAQDVSGPRPAVDKFVSNDAPLGSASRDGGILGSGLVEAHPAEPAVELAIEPVIDLGGSLSAALQTLSIEEDRGRPIDWGLADDWSDAEALVIRRVEAPPDVSAKAESDDAALPKPTADERVAVRIPLDAGADKEMAGKATAQDDGRFDAGWGDEAEVVIVRRPVGEVSPKPVAQTDAVKPVERGRSFGGAVSAKLPVPRGQGRRRDGYDEDDGAGYSQYSAFSEEATVTIIRAETSVTGASSIAPNGIANDAEAPDDDAQKPKSRAFGARFLKALTGDSSQ